MGFRVLVVDEYGLIRDSLSTIIELIHKEAVVDTAGTKAEAIRLIGEQRYDFVFLDLTLDGDAKPNFDLVDLCVASQSGKTVALCESIAARRAASSSKATASGLCASTRSGRKAVSRCGGTGYFRLGFHRF